MVNICITSPEVLVLAVVVSYTGYLSVLTVALMDTLSSLIAQIHFAVTANCLSPVVLLNMCDTRKVSEWRCWATTKIFELCKWAAKWKRSGMPVQQWRKYAINFGGTII